MLPDCNRLKEYLKNQLKAGKLNRKGSHRTAAVQQVKFNLHGGLDSDTWIILIYV